ncbi:MAG: ATP-dependent acyl-CoA ligase, partial [Solirubrobacteraceae bacterium]
MNASSGPPEPVPVRRLGPEHVAPPERTIPALLERRARELGDRPLLEIGELKLGYVGVRDRAARAAGTLRAAGVSPGDRVAALLGNRIELLDVFLGCAWLGAIAVPLNTALRGPQLEHVLVNSGAQLLIGEPDLLQALEHLPHRPSELQRLWVVGEDAADDARIPAGYAAQACPPPGEPVPAHPAAPGDTAAILYTSGTTGVSKGVQCPQAQFYWWGVMSGGLLEIGPDDTLYTVLPMFHTNALNAFLQAIVAGARFVIGERFSASRFWGELAASGATVTYLLGAMVSILMRRDPGPNDRTHRARVALAPATPTELHLPFRERFGITLVEGYGSTETNCCLGALPAQQRPGYMGPVMDGFDARVVDDADVEVPDGEAGELALRQREPFSFATGYFGMPEKTVEAWRNLWFHTGDLVVRDSDGWFRFVDRLKDSIRRRGENISTYEVEDAICQHDSVAAAAAFAVPSELSEDEVMVAVVLKEQAELTPLDLIRHCEPRLAYFAIPRYVDFIDELP